MVREKMKYNDGKFFLRSHTEKRLYLYGAGVSDVGTEWEMPYHNWTRWISTAMGFKTVKAARAMQRKLASQGIVVEVVNREGMVI